MIPVGTLCILLDRRDYDPRALPFVGRFCTVIAHGGPHFAFGHACDHQIDFNGQNAMWTDEPALLPIKPPPIAEDWHTRNEVWA